MQKLGELHHCRVLARFTPVELNGIEGKEGFLSPTF